MTAYTNYYYTLLQDLQALLRTEFGESIAVLIGDIPVIQNYPAITLEPQDKDVSGDISYGKKDMDFLVNIWVFHTHSGEEEAVKLLTETCENIEELLIDNRENPSDGSKWYISFPGKIKYGKIAKGDDLLRTAQIEWTFKKRVTK